MTKSCVMQYLCCKTNLTVSECIMQPEAVYLSRFAGGRLGGTRAVRRSCDDKCPGASRFSGAFLAPGTAGRGQQKKGAVTLMMQGDSYSLKIYITQEGAPVTPAEAEAVEIMLGPYRKNYPGELAHQDGFWLFPLSQAESLDMMSGRQPCQVRVKFTGGEVLGTEVGLIDVRDSLSREVL